MSKQYSNPPFIEAVFELQTKNIENNWDLTYHGLFYDDIKQDFPIKSREKKPNIAIKVNPQGMSITPNEDTDVLRIKNKNGNVVIHFSENTLVINALKPYPNWEEYKASISKCLNSYKSIVSPDQIEHLSLRYINVFDCEKNHEYSNIKTVFNLRPHVISSLSSNFSSFRMITEYLFEAGRDVLSIQQATLQANETIKFPVLFDLTYLLLEKEKLSFDLIETWLETAHQNIESTFEEGLTESIKKTFI